MSSGCACKIHPTRAVSLELLTLCSYHPHQSCYQRSHYCAQFLLTLCTINTPLIFINGLMTDSASAYSCINIKVKKVKQRRTQNNPRIQMDGSHIHTENIKFHRAGIRQMIWAYSGSGSPLLKSLPGLIAVVFVITIPLNQNLTSEMRCLELSVVLSSPISPAILLLNITVTRLVSWL